MSPLVHASSLVCDSQLTPKIRAEQDLIMDIIDPLRFADHRCLMSYGFGLPLSFLRPSAALTAS
jgi:hypothetical protein